MVSIRHSLSHIMPRTLGVLLLLLPLAAPLIAQDSFQGDEARFETSACHFYNETCANSEEGCPETDYCHTAEFGSFARCFVMWVNTSTSGVLVSFKGCIYHDPSCQNQCISEQWGKDGSPDNIIFYCCCHGNYCNDEFMWNPKEPHTTTPTRIPTNTGVFEAVILTFVVLILFFILASVLFYFYRKQKLANFIELPTVDTTVTQAHNFTNCSKPIQLVEIKAQGRFGAVWKAKYLNNYVAVKVFPQQDKDSWETETKIYSLPHMSHENVLRFIGFEEKCDSPNKELWLITAYHENGSLYDFLKANLVTWMELCTIGQSIARGLAFLHSECPLNKNSGLKPAVAHRDFKSKNVLIKSNLTACIADFGLALTFYPGQVPNNAQGQVGTRRYMAPEVLEGAISFQRDAFLPIDMYACALVLWELLSRCTAQMGPIADYELPFENEIGLYPSLEDMQDCVVTKKIRPRLPETWNSHSGMMAAAQMLTETWDHDAEARLSASCIAERFSVLARSAQLAHSIPSKEVY